MGATLAYRQQHSLLTFDTRNAFNSVKGRTILPALVDPIPLTVPYALNLYTREARKLPLKAATVETEIFHFSTGVPQRYYLGSLCYSAGLPQLPTRPHGKSRFGWTGHRSPCFVP